MIEPQPRTLTPSRIILGLALVIAIIAVGAAIWKRSAGTAPETASANPAVAPQADVKDLISRLEAKLKENPDDAEGWRMLGWSFFETGRFAEAATAYRRATALAPDNADYWSSLGEALVLAGAGDVPPDAAAAFAKAIANDPKDPRARYFMAVQRDMKGDSKGAIADWLALLADTPAGAPWEADLRRTIEQVGAREKIDVAARLAAVRPAPAMPGAAGAASVASAAIPGPSREQMAAASKLPPGQQEAMIQGMLDSLAAKLKANPRNADGWIMLMRSHMQLGQTQQARDALKSGRVAFADDQAQAARLTAAARELAIPGA